MCVCSMTLSFVFDPEDNNHLPPLTEPILEVADPFRLAVDDAHEFASPSDTEDDIRRAALDLYIFRMNNPLLDFD